MIRFEDFGKDYREKALGTHYLVLCQLEGWRMQYSRRGNVWRNRGKHMTVCNALNNITSMLKVLLMMWDKPKYIVLYV